MIVDAETGASADPVLVDAVSLRPLTEPPFRTAPGPAANEETRTRHGGRGAHATRRARRTNQQEEAMSSAVLTRDHVAACRCRAADPQAPVA